MPALRLDHVCKRFGQTDAVRDISFDVDNGAFCALIGPSGCGKSTVLRLIAGLDSVSAGAIRIGGRLVNDIGPAERGIAMVFQNYALYPHMTVEENLGFALHLTDEDAGAIRTRVRGTARTHQLEHVLPRHPETLSAGTQQGVAVGRSTIRPRDVLLFDEPLANLDADQRIATRQEIVRLHRKWRSTVVYVTSDQAEAMAMADRIVLMRDGRVEQAGWPLQLYDDPDSLFVAGFIGSPPMNFAPVVVRSGHPGALTVGFAERPDTTFAVPLDQWDLPPGTDLTLGIRPEHLRRATGMDPEAPGLQLPVTVEAVEHLGSATTIQARTVHGRALLIRERGSAPVKPGARLAVTAPCDKLRLFDETGRRLR